MSAVSPADDDAKDLPKPDGGEVFDADPQQFQSGELSQWFGRTFFREHWMRETGDDPSRQERVRTRRGRRGRG